MIQVRSYTKGESSTLDSSEISDVLDNPDCPVWWTWPTPPTRTSCASKPSSPCTRWRWRTCATATSAPSLEHYPSHAFIVAYTAELQEADFFLGPTWLVSVRAGMPLREGGQATPGRSG